MASLIEKITDDYIRELHKSENPAYIFDIETLSILDVNDRACAIYKHTREQFLSLKVLDLSLASEVEKTKAELFFAGNHKIYFGKAIHKTRRNKRMSVKIIADKIMFNGKLTWLVNIHVII